MAGTGQPRKFSEKIAIINRKQQEDLSEFNSVINEVRNITQGPSTSEAAGGHWPRHPGGSLPSLPAVVNIPNANPHPGMWDPQQQWATGHEVYVPEVIHGGRVIHPRRRGHSPGDHTYHPYRGSHSPGHVSPHRPSSSDISHAIVPEGAFPPHITGPLLNVPYDPGWRRTHSDPVLHQNVVVRGPVSPVNPNTPPQMLHSPGESDFPADFPSLYESHRYFAGDSPNPDNTQGSSVYLQPKEGMRQQRPQSCENAPNVPNISVTESSECQAALPVPISNNVTGSLPDLPSSLQPSPAHPQHPHYNFLPPHPNQQRHSIQLPLDMTRQMMQQHNSPQTTPTFTLEATPAYTNSSQSAPNSPASPAGLGGDSPVPSPGTVACNAVQAQLQGLTFQPQEMTELGTSPQQQQSAGWNMNMYQQQPQPHMYHQNHMNLQHPHYAVNPHADVSYPTYGMHTTQSSRIPEITISGADGISVGGGHYDHTVEDLDLNFQFQMTPAEMQEMQRMLANDHVDELSEDALRHETN